MEKSSSSCEEQQHLLEKYLSTIDPELIDDVLTEKLLRKICIDSEVDGAILVFLPDWEDINRTRERLKASHYFSDPSKFSVIALHSMVPSVEQKKVFRRPPPGCRKIVISTNIAETAITIDDVVYVIDSGRMKEKSYDPYNNVSTLQSSWVSKTSAKQREGRAGRCQPGICYHLYSKLRAASLPDFQVPEIKRIPIEELCLQVKLLNPDCKIEEFLQKTLDPPVYETIRNAIIVLQDIGALSIDEKLTELGERLGSLPVHPLTSKMLLIAILLNCLDPALTLACASDYRDPFTLPMLPNEKKRAAAAKAELASWYGGRSDQLAVVAAFDGWKSAKENGQESRFCSMYFVSSSTMHMLSGMRKQLQSELLRIGFIRGDGSSCSLNAQDPGILHAVLVAGLYPMVGRLLLPLKGGKRAVIETADIVVAPGNEDDDDDNDDDESDYEDADEDDGEEDNAKADLPDAHQGDTIMSSPDNTVKVIVDRWIPFESTALDVAQVYCLRERLAKAILFKVTHPGKVLPDVLAASIYAMSCILSYNGMAGISLPLEPMDLLTTMANATEIGQSDPGRNNGMDMNPNNSPNSFGYNGWHQRPYMHHQRGGIHVSKGSFVYGGTGQRGHSKRHRGN
ncbi:hypothetical protein K7X08_012543 [Anisodus acutangulus]|uniref:RNA helicase n=1 Tax=Anisodus acutangulus TaxID=402998 RepID=A0A9Q1LAX5_9SOLA|nr:hypothetical protein K7X08_012543 [Anisodus acutangulus]